MTYVNSISVSPISLALPVVQWYRQTKAIVYPENADCTSVRWHSDNTDVATVNESSGYIYAKAIGTARIYATAIDGSEKSNYMTVTVSQTVPVESVALDKVGLALKKGTSNTLGATVYPSTASNKDLNWDSSHPEIVAVDDNGVLTGLECGTAIITVTAADGSGASDNCTVWVTEDILVTSITVTPECHTIVTFVQI